MTITSAVPNTFKQECLVGTHNFTASSGDTSKLALFKSGVTGTYGSGTTNYSDMTGNSDEASATGYTAGGFTLTNATPIVNGGQACCDWTTDPSWTITGTLNTDGALAYNSSKSNKAIGVFSFGATQTTTNATFTLIVPAQTASNAIIRFQ